MGDLRPRGAYITPESDHEHRRNGREYANDHSTFGDKLVPAFGTQSIEKAKYGGSGGEGRNDVEQIA